MKFTTCPSEEGMKRQFSITSKVIAKKLYHLIVRRVIQ